MQDGSLQCQRCGAWVAVPPDPTALSVRCTYCGLERWLPDQAARRAALQHRQELEARVRVEQHAHTEREQTARLSSRRTLLFAGGLVLLTGGGLSYLGYHVLQVAARASDALESTPGVDPAQAGLPALRARIAQAQTGACGRTFIEPQSSSSSLQLRFTLSESSCARLFAVAGSAGAPINVGIVGGDGQPVPAPAAAPAVDHLYCPPRLGGTHQVDLTSTGAFSAAAVECTRQLPTDPAGVGSTRVAELTKQRYAAGCRQIVMAAKTYVGAHTFTATLSPGACLQVLAATGMTGNDVRLALTTPFGEAVPAPPAAREAVLSYCAKAAGPHQLSITPALAGPFTAAGIVCPKRAMPR